MQEPGSMEWFSLNFVIGHESGIESGSSWKLHVSNIGLALHSRMRRVLVLKIRRETSSYSSWKD